MYAILAAALTAAAGVLAAYLTREQTKRTEKRLANESARAEERLQLDTAINGLKLLTIADGSAYAQRGVVAGAIATLGKLRTPVIAMRALSGCWADEVVDVGSAMWVLSLIFEDGASQPDESQAEERRTDEDSTQQPTGGEVDQARLEAAAMLDTHASELCGERPGSLSWPRRLEFRWIPSAPLWARLYVLRAILTTEVEKDPTWWHQGGRLGWAASLLRAAMQADEDDLVRSEAKRALEILMPVVEFKLSEVQSEHQMVPTATIRKDMERVSCEWTRRVAMLTDAFEHLGEWAQSAREQGFYGDRESSCASSTK